MGEFGYECEKGLGECLLSSVSDAYNYCSDASHMTYDMTVDEYCDWECDAEDDLCLGWLADCPGFYHCEQQFGYNCDDGLDQCLAESVSEDSNYCKPWDSM